MLEGNNLILLLASMIPAIFYAFIVYVNGPKNNVTIFKTTFYGLLGCLSMIFLYILFALFPNIHSVMFSDPSGKTTMLSVIVLAFIQVALIEESLKFLSFIIPFKVNNEKETRFSIMFYCMISAATFAIIETLFKAVEYDGMYVVLIRSTTATVLHMCCGLISGYFASYAFVNQPYKNSEWAAMFKSKPFLKRSVYIAIGLIISTILHGVYDFNLFIGQPYLVVITAFTVLISYLCYVDVIKNHKHGK